MQGSFEKTRKKRHNEEWGDAKDFSKKKQKKKDFMNERRSKRGEDLDY